jgi:glycosyltransferase involved in cell wall biosynthesis
MERKGIHFLLAALEQLEEGVATLHLAGDERVDPAYADRIHSQLARPALQRRVVMHGPLPAEGVAQLYAAADVFVLPSLREPYGTVYGEAMAAGLPVVGWRAGNLPYLAGNGREGLLVEPGDVAGLARALDRLARDEPLRRQLGQAAAQRAAGRPTWEESAAMFFTAIREVVEQ